MTTLEQNSISRAIEILESRLHKALLSASQAMEDVKHARLAVTNESLKHRGWGMDDEFRAFHEMAETLVYDIMSNITELGGGLTIEQDERLKRIAKVL